MTSKTALTIAVLGTGNMGEAIIRGLAAPHSGPEYRIAACDVFPEKAEALAREFTSVSVAASPGDAVEHADVIVLAVKPKDVLECLEELRPGLERRGGTLILSVAAGVRLESLRSWAGGSNRFVRCMPNLPATIGRGVTAVFAPQEADFEVARAVLAGVGEVVRVADEGQIDAATAVSGSGPAFACLMLEAVIDAGTTAGLPRPLAKNLALAMLRGTAEYLERTGLEPEEVRKRVSSPNGTTVAGLGRLEALGARTAFYEAVTAAAKRAAELAAESAAGKEGAQK